VEPRAPSSSHDPDLDPPRRRPSDPGRPPFLPQEYQRLVANPFLAVFGLIVGLGVFWKALELRELPLVALALVALISVAYLLQYHCLDCGSTGLLLRWKSHACERVLARQQANQVRRFRGPNPTFQTVLWGYALLVLAILVFVVMLAVRA
jgi:hypothetical protein